MAMPAGKAATRSGAPSADKDPIVSRSTSSGPSGERDADQRRRGRGVLLALGLKVRELDVRLETPDVAAVDGVEARRCHRSGLAEQHLGAQLSGTDAGDHGDGESGGP